MSAPLALAVVAPETALKERVFEELRRAILEMDVYAEDEAPRLDERTLAGALGVSRTPVREALSRLEQEGLVRKVPRRGMFVARKSRREIVEIIEVWAALESMAARLATRAASDAALRAFEAESARYRKGDGAAEQDGPDGRASGGRGREDGRESVVCGGGRDVPIDEYSEGNVAFHQAIIALSGNEHLVDTARPSFAHMRAIRASAIRDPARRLQSVIDHRRIVEALMRRDAARAERLVREHALALARHVERHVDFLD